jgi:hypothetical protein
MKISHLVEFTIDEAFNDMSQKATNIAAGKGAATDAEVRQQRIAQLSANQKARNAAPAGKPIAPATAQPAAPATAQPAATPAPDAATSARIAAAPQGYDTETGQPIGQQPAQQAAPATGTPAPAGAKGAVTGLANTVGTGVAKGVGGLAKGVGAVGGGIAGAFDKIKQGYQAGRGAVSGNQAPAGGGTAPAGATAADNAEITQLVNRVSALEKAVGIAESYKFESKFLKMDI